MATDYRATAEAMLWKKDSKYTRNFAKSIGTIINEGGSKLCAMVIDLENGIFYNPKEYETPIKFCGSYNDIAANVGVRVDGSLSTDICTIGGLTIEKEYLNEDNGERKEKVIMEFNEKKLDITPTEINGVIATESKLNEIKESLNLDKNKLITFLEIIKFIPDLSDKRAEIEALIESLNQGE